MRRAWIHLACGFGCAVLAGATALPGCVTGTIDDASSGAGAAPGGAGGAAATGPGGGGEAPGGAGGTGGAGGGFSCGSPEDCPGLDTTCRFRTCAAGKCGFAEAHAGTSCSEDGGQLCDDSGRCVECLGADDCLGGVCQAGLCVAATCTDNQQNGDETAVDCGGSCAPCGNGQGCQSASDCSSKFCNNGSCAPCGAHADCGAAAWCDAGTCQNKKLSGDVCLTAAECASGFCPGDDGICCDAACTGVCRACVAGKTGAANGTCAPVTAQSDPDLECPAQPAATCGSSGMGCNGSASSPGCLLHPQGTVCSAATCSGGQQTTAGLCDGGGTCQPGSSSPCTPYVCGTSACLTDCTQGANADCASGYQCQSGVCALPGGNGTPCTSNGQCASGYCRDGVCCNSACTGTCRACDVSGAVGTCANIPPNTDPDNECMGSDVCNGSGACMQACGGAGPGTTPLDSEEQALLVLINNHRVSNGRAPLTACTSLNRAAQGHSEDMRDQDYFSHTSLNGDSFVDRACDACYSRACPLSTAMAENIAAGSSGAAATFNQWLNSPGHNANMLGTSYTVIGIGRATGGGTYGTYWTNVFAGQSEASCN